MFTGIVAGTGRIAAMEARPSGIRLEVEAGEVLPRPSLGDSVAVDGCCLTVVGVREGTIAFDVVPETLRRTTLGRRAEGDRVNLELPLRASDRMGGHFVQGHVDAVAVVRKKGGDGGEARLTFDVPAALRGHIVEKGSVAIDGVSLTVAAVEGDSFTVALIPHTLEVTTLWERCPGDAVNVEGDVLAKYVASLMGGRR